MSITTARPHALTAEEILSLCRRHTLFDWMAQSDANPLAVDHAKGVYFYTTDGKRYLDFNSQLMSVNAGHGDPRIINAIKHQLDKLAYVNPIVHAHEARALLGKKLAERMPGDVDRVYFALGGAEANEYAIKIARLFTGRQKILARYRSYHGGAGQAIALTGEPRRWANEPSTVGVVHVLDPYHGPQRNVDTAEEALRYLDETIQLEGPETIAASILEPVVGTNGVLIPPAGYLQGVRALCDRQGILLICDEVMSGFGRTGEWFAVDHWKVVPDLMTMAKGLTSSYVPLSAVGMRHPIG
jgi:taurine--2-oxoglutarate transaminase